jgi:hypothetical protein
LGIGIGAPASQLDVRGNIYVSGTNGGLSLFDRTVGVSSSQWYRSAAKTHLGDNDSSTNRVTIDNATGAVGVGISAPTSMLTIVSNTAVSLIAAQASSTQLAYFDLINTGTTTNAGTIMRLVTQNAAKSALTTVDIIKYNNAGFYVNNNEPNQALAVTAFGVSGAERMRINGYGNVGIGSNAPTAKLEVAGHVELSGATSNTISWGTTGSAAPGVASAGLKLQLYGATPGTMAANDYALGIESATLWFNSGSSFKWYTGAVQRMLLDGSGNLTIPGTAEAYAFAHPSDRNLKQDITTITSPTEVLESLRGTHFRWKANGKPAYGVIAQEVQQILPEPVTKGDGHLRVDYDQLVPVLIEGWKTHQNAIGALRADNEVLQHELKAANDNNRSIVRRLDLLESGTRH